MCEFDSKGMYFALWLGDRQIDTSACCVLAPDFFCKKAPISKARSLPTNFMLFTKVNFDIYKENCNFAPQLHKQLKIMAVTALKRKDRRNKTVAQNRIAQIKRLTLTPTIKLVDVEEIKASFTSK